MIRPSKSVHYTREELPPLTLVVACFNEADIIAEKIENSLQLQYPEEKLTIYFVSDGSSDTTPDIISKYSQIKLFHSPERKGKSAAINRIMPKVTTPLVVFSDANTMLNSDALELIARHYADHIVGAVAGEKKIMQQKEGDAVTAGEGIYWKYESKLKKWDSELKTVVGAAGELFSVRRELFEEVPKDILIEDFYLSMRIVEKGYRVVYEPLACAVETGSESMSEEMKRKVRISAGGIQAILRMRGLYNFFKHGIVTFQFISHRVLRWSLTPLALLLLLISNILLWDVDFIYQVALYAQLFFYFMAILGGVIGKRKIGIKGFFVPYYFAFMNYSVFLGLIRLLKGNQSVLWEKAKRKTADTNK